MRPDLDDAVLRLYLLGLLPEAEAEALEEAYFARPDILARVRGVEDDLLDDYVAGRLVPSDQKALERRYLASAPLRERVVAARALRLAAPDSARGAAPVIARPARWKVPLAVAAGLFVAVMAFGIRTPNPPPSNPTSSPPVEIARAETPLPPDAALRGSSGPAGSNGGRREGVAPLVLALSPVLLRGQGQPVGLRITSGIDTVVLELEGDRDLLPPRASALQVVVNTVEGEEVWRGDARRLSDAGKRSLLASTNVPAARLAAGDYLLTLSVRGPADGTLYRYFFRVSR